MQTRLLNSMSLSYAALNRSGAIHLAEHRDARGRRHGNGRWKLAIFPAMHVARLALPMLLVLLKMALVIAFRWYWSSAPTTSRQSSPSAWRSSGCSSWISSSSWPVGSTAQSWTRSTIGLEPATQQFQSDDRLEQRTRRHAAELRHGKMFLILPTFGSRPWGGRVKVGVIAQNPAVGFKEARDTAGAGVNKVAGRRCDGPAKPQPSNGSFGS